jgi:EmrB/QacA subfamily drug resistance transporter
VRERLGRGWLTVAIIGVGAATGPLDSSVNIAFPDITGGFGKPLGAIQWVIIAYVLTYASLLLNFGRFADIAGHRRVFIGGLLVNALGLSACALAPSYEWLLFTRTLQGLGTALVLATAPALVTLSFSDALRPRALGAYAMFLTGASAVGPLAGGLLVSEWGWPAVFWYRVPIALVAAAATFVWVQRPSIRDEHKRFDLQGAVALSVTMVSLLLTLNRVSATGWSAPTTWLLSACAVGGLAWFATVELKSANPVIELRLFKNLQFSIANSANVLLQMAAFSVFLLAPYFLVRYTQGNVALAGLLLGVSPVAGAVAAMLAGRALSEISSWALSVVGTVFVTLGLAGISLWSPDIELPWLIGSLVINGIGLGLFQVANMDYVMSALPRTQHGVAGALTMLTRTIGVVASATLGSVAFAELGGQFPTAGVVGERFMNAFSQVFAGAACVALAAFTITAIAGRGTR